MSSDEQLDYMIDGWRQKIKQLADENLRLRDTVEDALWKQHRIRINIDEGHTYETAICPRRPEDDAEFWPCSDPDDPQECTLVAWVENQDTLGKIELNFAIKDIGWSDDGPVIEVEL